MTLNEAVAKLTTLIPVLKASDAKFASDLIASYKKYGSLTVKQEPWIGKLILRAETNALATALAPDFSAPVAPSVVSVGNFAGVVALFATAKEHLKFPKVRLVLDGVKLVLSLNGLKSKAPGAVAIKGEGKYPYVTYYGKVTPEGVFQPTHAGQDLASLTDLLIALAANPARVAKEHGKLTGACCFCNKALGLGKEQRSVLVGYGPDCAEHYGLKAEWLAAASKAEAKASVTPVNVAALAEKLMTSSVAVPTGVASLAQAAAQAAEPTLTVSPAAQAMIDGLAQSIAAVKAEAKAFSLSAVTTLPTKSAPKQAAIDGLVEYTYGPSVPCEYCGTSLHHNVADGIWVDATDGDGCDNPTGVHAPADVPVEPGVCFFCEQPSTETKTLHGYTVCSSCAAQLQ